MYMRAGAILKIANVEISFDDFKFEWSYTAEDDNTPSFLELSLHNLSSELKSAIKKGISAIFNFGYGDDISEFIVGVVDTVTHEKQSTSIVTKIKIFESAITNFSNISTSFVKGTKADYIIKNIATLSNITVDELTLVNNLTYKTGYVAYGKALNLIKQIAKSCGSSVKVNGATVSIYNPSSTKKTTGHLIDFTTGLLTEPEVFTEEKKEYDYKIKCMAYPSLKKNSIFKIKSDTYSGFVQILKLSIDDFVAEYVVMTR